MSIDARSHHPTSLGVFIVWVCLVAGCLPEGEEPAADPDCASKSVESCEEGDSCALVYGSPLDPERACWGAPEVLACGGTFANNATTYVTGPDGACWRFPNSQTASGEGWGDDPACPPEDDVYPSCD